MVNRIRRFYNGLYFDAYETIGIRCSMYIVHIDVELDLVECSFWESMPGGKKSHRNRFFSIMIFVLFELTRFYIVASGSGCARCVCDCVWVVIEAQAEVSIECHDIQGPTHLFHSTNINSQSDAQWIRDAFVFSIPHKILFFIISLFLGREQRCALWARIERKNHHRTLGSYTNDGTETMNNNNQKTW